MIISKESFNIFGELKSKELENLFWEDYWLNSKNVFFISYNLCCILLLFAGIFFDFYRTFVIGSAQSLLFLRIGLVFAGLVMFFTFRKKEKFEEKIFRYGFFLMLYSTVIIVLLTIWTAGNSFTLMPGVLIMIASFYIALPSRFIYSFICSLILFLTYCFFFNYELVGLKAHYYMCFMLLSINLVLIYFKIFFDKNQRMNFLIKEYHKDVSNAKNTILKIIGHDLKNPLTIVSNMGNLVKKCITNDDKDRAFKYLDSIENASDKVAQLLESLLDWSLSEKIQEVDEIEYREIFEICDHAISFCSELAQDKSIEIINSVEHFKVPCNDKMIETVIRNLLVNSIKFSPKDKKISIYGKKNNNHYELKIVDEGQGMDDELIHHILSGSNNTSTLGTHGEKGGGLGMKMVVHFIQSHSGKFEIKSTVNRGSEFIISLPINY